MLSEEDRKWMKIHGKELPKVERPREEVPMGLLGLGNFSPLKGGGGRVSLGPDLRDIVEYKLDNPD